jgi:glycerol-3-phosphate dehydrogenase (NAD(P)+)
MTHDRKTMKAAVIGAGSWGAALAILLHQNGLRVRAWEYDEALVERFQEGHREVAFLPGISFPEGLEISHDPSFVLEEAELVVLAVPSQALRSVLKQMGDLIPKSALLVDVAKGIEKGTLCTMSQLVHDCLPEHPRSHLVCLSGPSHAEEVSRSVPTVVVAAGSDESVLHEVQGIFSNDTFRVYTNLDLMGVEMGGALKNVIALAAGMCDGLGFGDNSKGALMTRGMVEIARLGVALGGEHATFWGLSGMGDLITTCSSRHSRNRFVGERLGKGESLEAILADMTMVAEGVRTTEAAHFLAEREGIDMPITTAVYRALFEGADPRKEVLSLMTRRLKREHPEAP